MGQSVGQLIENVNYASAGSKSQSNGRYPFGLKHYYFLSINIVENNVLYIQKKAVLLSPDDTKCFSDFNVWQCTTTKNTFNLILVAHFSCRSDSVIGNLFTH